MHPRPPALWPHIANNSPFAALFLCDRRRERTGRRAVGAAVGHRPARGARGTRRERGAALARHVRLHGVLVRGTLGTHHVRRGHRPGAAHRRRGPLRHHLGPQDQNAEAQNDVSACARKIIKMDFD
jgi:hypothetical protein